MSEKEEEKDRHPIIQELEKEARVETADWFYMMARQKIRESNFTIKTPEALELVRKDPATIEYFAKQFDAIQPGLGDSFRRRDHAEVSRVLDILIGEMEKI